MAAVIGDESQILDTTNAAVAFDKKVATIHCEEFLSVLGALCGNS